jgi:hypothetical protein
MNDTVCDAEIQSRIVEPRRQEDAIEWLQSDAFRTLVDELFTQLTEERLLLGRKGRTQKSGRVFHNSPSCNAWRTQPQAADNFFNRQAGNFFGVSYGLFLAESRLAVPSPSVMGVHLGLDPKQFQ